jgi:hypothetical protein
VNTYPRYDDDVLALDYLPARSALTWDLPTWTSVWRKQMNKQLTHVAYARVLTPLEWDHTKWYPPLHQEFVAAWDKFQTAITDHDFKNEFERRKGSLAIQRWV